MKLFTKQALISATLCVLMLGQKVFAQTGVLNPNDTVVIYDPNNPPAIPAQGTMAKWVKTNRVGYNTNAYKCYFYNGMAFRLMFPPDYSPGNGKLYPVYTFFHGIGEWGTIYDNENQLVHGGDVHMYANQNGQFDGFLLYPQSSVSNGYFNTADYDATYQIIVNYLIPQVQADPNRILVDGLSGGGEAAWGFVTRYPKIAACLTPMSTASQAYNNQIQYIEYTPIRMSTGGQDKGPSPTQASVNTSAYQQAGADFQYKLYTTLGHDVWDSCWAEPSYFPFLNAAHQANPWTLFGKNQFCPGSTINVTVGVIPGFDQYQWTRNGVAISGATTNSINVTSTGIYACRFLNGSYWSPWSPHPDTISYYVSQPPPPITINGIHSDLIPAPDGSTTVPLMVPANYSAYAWQQVGSSTVLSTVNTLNAANAGQYQVKVTDALGCAASLSSPFTVISAAGTNPPPPATGVTVSTLGLTSLQLDWSTNPTPQYPATGVEVYRATAGASGPYTMVALLSPSALSYKDTALNPNTKYYYELRNVNGTAAATVSTPASGTTGADTQPPTAPGNLNITTSTRNSAALSWTASTDNVGVTEYDVYVNGVKSYILPPTTTSYTVYNLNYGKFYDFTVTARDFAGNTSPYSNEATTQAVTQGLNYNYYTFTGTWNDLANFSTLTPASSGVVSNVTLGPATQTTNFAFLYTGYIHIPTAGLYTFELNSDDGSSMWLGGLNQQGSPYNFSKAPLVNNDGLHGTQNVTDTITLAAGYYPIAIGYYQQGGGYSVNLNWITPTTGGQFTAVPDSVFVDPATVTNPPVPAAPTKLTASALSYTKIALAWTASTANVTGFAIFRSTDSINYTTIATVGPTATTYTDTTVSGGTTYWYRIEANGKNGVSGFAMGSSGVPYNYYNLPGDVGQLPNFNTMTPTFTGIDTAFGLGMQTQNNDFALKFSSNIYIPTTGSYTFATNSDDGSALYIDGFDANHEVVNNDYPHGPQTVSGTVTLTAGYHQIYVTFFQDGGGYVLTAYYQGPGIPYQPIPSTALVGAPLTARVATAALPPAPTAPSNLIATGISSTRVSVTWSDTVSNETAVQIYRSANTDQNYVPLATLAAHTTAFVDSNLFADAIYYYKVRSVNLGGNSPFSGEDSALTLDYVPVVKAIAQQYVRYGSTLQVPVTATDSITQALTVVVNNLPAFGTYASTGNGTGTITFAPTQAQQGNYSNITVAVTDAHGSTASTSFNLTVDSIYTPVIAPVSNVTLNPKSTQVVTLTATDSSSSATLGWSFSGLPGFATVTTSGKQAQISLAPGYADNGTYTVVATINDTTHHRSGTQTFVITVNKVNPNKTVLVNFNDGTTAAAAAPWNNTANKTPNAGTVFSGLLDSTGAASNVRVSLVTSWTGVNDAGATTGNNSGVFPDAVLTTSYYTSGAQTVKLLGLDVKSVYSLTMTASRANPTVGVVTTYTVNGNTLSVNASNNTSAVATFTGITPAADSSVTITVNKASGSTYGYLNGLAIRGQYNDSTAPAKPRNFAVAQSGRSVVLSWIDAAYNETSYSIFRSTSATGPFTALTTTGAVNLQAYTDSTVVGNTTYYYMVAPVNQYGTTYSDTLSVATPELAPLLAPVSNVSMKTYQTTTVNVSAATDPSNTIAFTATNVPAFGVFTDNGNGTGSLVLTPNNTTGVFSGVTITATDSHGVSSSQTFSVTVVDSSLRTTEIHFNQTIPAAAPWNNFNSAPSAGAALSNLTDVNGNATGMNVSLTEAWTGSSTAGVNTGNNSGLYPDAVSQSFYYETGANTQHVVLSGLSASKRYNLVFFASRANYTSSLITTYTVGSTTVQLDANNNSTNTVQINAIAPDSTGKITVAVLKASSSPNAYLNAIVVQSYNTSNAVLAPGTLTAAGSSKTAIQLGWQTTTSGVTDYEVWRSANYYGPFTKIGDAGTALSYIDSGLAVGTTEFYEVRSLSAGGYSPYSNVAGASTVAFTIDLNYNDGAVAPAQASPWNNTNTMIANGFTLPNMINDQALPTGVNMTVLNTFDGFNNLGDTTVSNNGVVPNNVSKSFFYNNYGDTAKIVISGLDQAWKYNLGFFGSRINPSVGVTTTYKVGNQTVQLNASNNTSNVAWLNGLTPDSTGSITFQVAGAISGGYGYLNALFVQGVPGVDTVGMYNGTNVQSQKTTVGTAVASNKFANSPDSLKNNAVTSVMAFPNPFVDDVTLRLDLTENVDKFAVLVVDVMGRVIMKKEFYNAGPGVWQQAIGLNGSRLAKGIYLIQVTGITNQAPQVFKVIKE